MGKGGGPLNAWLKEFCTLVFTQTIQAFIYAITISIILYGMHPENVQSDSGDDINAAIGLMSVFALLSVFKVEDMARRIFSVGDTKADHKSAMQSLAKTAIAAQIGKRVLNNGSKVLGGVGKIASAGNDKRKANARLNEDVQDAGFKRERGGKLTYTGNKNINSNVGQSRVVTATSGSSTNISGDYISNDGTSYNRDSKGYSDPTKSVKSALRNYENKIEDIKKARREGIKDITSGLLEMGTAVGGGAVGAVIGAASTGDLEDAFRGMATGAGIGDAIAEGTVNAIDKAAKFTKDITKNYGKGTNGRRVKKALDNYNKEVEKSAMNYTSHNVEDI